MENLKLRQIYWISPPNLGGENVSSITYKYLHSLYNWQNDEVDPVLIYCGSESQLEHAVKAKEKLNVPLIMNFWGWPTFRFPDKDWLNIYRLKAELINEAVDLITAPSSFQLNQLITLGVYKLMHIVPPGVDSILAFKASSELQQSTDGYFVSVGRIVEHKNFETVIEAMNLRKLNFVKYVIVGNGEDSAKKKLMEKAESKGINLEIKSSVSDYEKFQILSMSIAILVPSVYEGFGMPIVEGASVGKPVIAFNLPIYRELFGDSLEYFNSISELGHILYEMLINPILYKAMSSKNALLARKFSATYTSGLLNKVLIDFSTERIKNKAKLDFDNKKITLSDLYNIEAQIDREYFSYRLNVDNNLYNPRVYKLFKYIGDPKGKKVLDVGSSNGVFSCWLAKNKADVTAIDISDDYLDSARKNVKQCDLEDKIKLFKMDATKMSFKDSSFDAVWAGEIIEHFKDPSILLAELARVLKPGGRLIFTVPRGMECLDATHEVFFHTIDDLRKLFEKVDSLRLLEVEICGEDLGRNNWAGYAVKK